MAWVEVIRRTRPGCSASVSAFVDTNILGRHLTRDPPDLAARATAYLERENELLLTAW